VAVFVPVGAALTLATLPQPGTRRRTWRQKLHRWLGIAVGATLLSLAIEVAQLRVPGRSTDVDDLILNSLGAILGAALMQLLFLAVKRRPHD
jgi:glycopeptide antibiotics resistance protein